MGAQIRLPNPAEDRPRMALVVACAVAGVLLGLAAVLMVARDATRAPRLDAPDTHAPRTVPTAARHAPTAPRAAKAALPIAETTATRPAGDGTALAPAGAAAPAEQGLSSVAASGGPAAKPTESKAAAAALAQEPSAAPASRVTQIVPGRVAYVRCDGLSVQSGPYPCPRDRVLEAAVWDLLDTVRECRGARPSADERGAELRLDFQGSSVTEAHIRVPAPEQRALEAALERCLLEPLRRVETKLHSAHMVVSFRFQML